MEKTHKLEMVILTDKNEQQTIKAVQKMLDTQFIKDNNLKSFTLADLRKSKR